MNNSLTEKPEAPYFSAFREASFGVGGLVIHNETHSKFSWHRHACGSSSKGAPSYGMNFSVSCMTPGDNSAQAMLTSDEVWLVRPSQVTCPQRWSPIDSDDYGSIENFSSSDNISVTTAAVVSALLIFFGVIVSLVLFCILSTNYSLLSIYDIDMCVTGGL